MYGGCSFYWGPGRPPIFTTPDECNVTLMVEIGLLWLTNDCCATAAPVQESGGTDGALDYVVLHGMLDINEDVHKCQKSSQTNLVKEILLMSKSLSLRVTLKRRAGGTPPAWEQDHDSEALPDWKKVPHSLVHMPKHSKCAVCCSALAVKKYSRRKASTDVEEELAQKHFGSVITADHTVNQQQYDHPITGQKVALVLCDRGTDWLGAFPRASRSADATITACNQFVGPQDQMALFV